MRMHVSFSKQFGSRHGFSEGYRYSLGGGHGYAWTIEADVSSPELSFYRQHGYYSSSRQLRKD